MRSTLVLAASLALAGSAMAQMAPSETGATALAESLSTYFGKTAFEKKVVTVVPESKGYRITFAPNGAIAALLEPGSKVDMKPYSMLASERSDGNWDVSSTDPLALSFDVVANGVRQTGNYAVEAGTFRGVYSPKLGAFLSGTAAYPGGSMTASEPASDMKATFGAIGYDISAKEAGAGAVDGSVRQTMSNLEETVAIKADPEAGTPETTVSITLAKFDAPNTLTGLKSRALLDLWAFAVAHADKQALVKDQEALRGLITAALPVWKTIAGSTDLSDLDITTAFGTIAAKTAAFKLTADGVSTASSFRYGLEMSGLSVESPMTPAWAANLIPQDLSLTLKIDGVDLETPAKRAIAEFDLSKDPVLPEETTQAIAAGFAASPPRLVIEPSRLTSRDLDVTVKGEFLFAGAEPQSNVTIEAKGLDKVIAALQAEAAKDPSVNEAVGGLALAQGFAKPLPDGRSQWIVETKADGSVILNGNQLVAPTAETETVPAPTDENALPTEDPAATTP